jgi:hypothetical protein
LAAFEKATIRLIPGTQPSRPSAQPGSSSDARPERTHQAASSSRTTGPIGPQKTAVSPSHARAKAGPRAGNWNDRNAATNRGAIATANPTTIAYATTSTTRG